MFVTLRARRQMRERGWSEEEIRSYSGSPQKKEVPASLHDQAFYKYDHSDESGLQEIAI